jgi:DNA-binding transcriptional regulator GbsR (MarR family)
MARALADPWRFRILIEVTVRPLSPSRFVEDVGGELTHISRCFRQLADWGYLEVVEERPGRRRGASIEHVYRAIQRAYFDTPTWKNVPLSGRNAVSRSILGSYQQRIREAVETGTFDRELDRHLSWDTIALDRVAWEQLGEDLDAVLDSLSDLELEATKRLAAGDGEQMPTTVGLTAFRSPDTPSQMLRGSRRHDGPLNAVEPTGEGIEPKLVKALSNRWRCRILMEVSIRPMSPSQFMEEVGGSMTHVSRCFRDLAKLGFVEIVEERKGGRRGGGVERIYRSTLRAFFDTQTWITLPQIIREEISQFFLDGYFDRISEAFEAGTIDAELDRHLSWKPVVIDRPAWTQIGKSLDEILTRLPKLEADSTERIEDVEDLIPTTVGLASFRSPSVGGKAK